MVIFNGELTGKCLEFAQRRHRNKWLLLSGGTCILGILSVIGALRFLSPWSLLVSLPLAVAMPGMCLMEIRKGVIFPASIQVFDDGALAAAYGKAHYRWAASDVKCVKDMGEWYLITLKSIHQVNTVICQKNLLVQGADGDTARLLFQEKNYPNATHQCQKTLLAQGSLEEFERVYADKLVRGNR